MEVEHGPDLAENVAAAVRQYIEKQKTESAWSSDIAREQLGDQGYAVMTTLLSRQDLLAKHGIEATLYYNGTYLLRAVEPQPHVNEEKERRSRLIEELRASIDQDEVAREEQNRENYRRRIIKYGGDGRGIGGWSS